MKKAIKILPLAIYLGVLVGLILLTVYVKISSVWAIVWGFSPIALIIAFLVIASIFLTLADRAKDQLPSEDTCMHNAVAKMDGQPCIGRTLGCKNCESCDYYERMID